MSTAYSAQGTQVKIGTGSGGAKTITGVDVGNPTILTSAAHGFANGDVVTFSSGFTGADAAELNGKTGVVQFKTTNTFAVAFDTTGKTITAGTATATPVTYTKVANVDSFNGLDGSASTIDKSDFDSTAKEFMLGLVDNGNLSINCNDDGDDAGQAALEAARVAGSREAFKVIMPSGSIPNFTFYGYVMKFPISGQVDGKVQRTVDIKIDGAVTRA